MQAVKIILASITLAALTACGGFSGSTSGSVAPDKMQGNYPNTGGSN